MIIGCSPQLFRNQSENMLNMVIYCSALVVVKEKYKMKLLSWQLDYSDIHICLPFPVEHCEYSELIALFHTSCSTIVCATFQNNYLSVS